MASDDRPSRSCNGPAAIQLLGGFSVTVGNHPIPVPPSSQQLVGYLALQARVVERSQVVGILWPDKTEERAYANLRAAVWRLNRVEPDLIHCDGTGLSIRAGVSVDHGVRMAWAERVIADDLHPDDLRIGYGDVKIDLLPGWYEDWVILERERVRQWLVAGLEASSALLLSRSRYPEAVYAGLAAVELEPLRETGHRAVIEAHLAAGNLADARRQFGTLKQLLNAELGVDPSPDLQRLVPNGGRCGPTPGLLSAHLSRPLLATKTS